MLRYSVLARMNILVVGSGAREHALSWKLRQSKRLTDLFVTPGFTFRTVDRLLTNFHLPKSTLLMLACAFGGKENVLRAYRHAVEKRYRFFSYGDAMLIERG